MLSYRSEENQGLITKVTAIGFIALLLIYVICIISRPTISPEIGLAFLTVDSIKSVGQALGKFLEFHEVWYRPLTFYLTNFFVFQLIDIHDIQLIKVISLFVIFLNVFITTELAKKIFNSTVIERVIIFSLIVTHPLYYSVAFEGSGIVDPIFTIFINLFLICFIALLDDSGSKISVVSRFSGKEKWSLVGLCCFFVICTITAQERGLAIFPMMGLLYLFYKKDEILSKKIKLESSTISVLGFSFVLFLLYMFLVYDSKGQWTGEHYRTAFEPQYVLPNLVKSIELPFRLFFHKMGRAYDAHYDFLFNFFASPFIAALIFFVFCAFKNGDKKEQNGIIILTIFFLCSLPIPLLFGGNSWHFYTASLYLSILTGRAFYFLLQLLRDKYLKAIFVVLLFILLSVSTVRGINQELPKDSDFMKFMLMMDAALKDKTLHDVNFVPEVVYYDTGDWGSNTWPFGGQGNLFKYVYNDSKITEIALSGGKVLESEKNLCKNFVEKKILSFGFDAKNLSWHAIKNQDYCRT